MYHYQKSKGNKVFYRILNSYYYKKPYFINPAEVPGIEVLRSSWKIIRDELEEFRQKGKDEQVSSRTAYKYQPKGWKTITLLTYGYKYHSKCADFPRTLEALQRIPGISLISINILAPGAKIKSHYGDCNATYRCSLGITIPAGLPDCGIRVGNEEREWREGEVVVFEDANRHRVWNSTDQYRVVVVVDIFKEKYRSKMLGICGKVWASFLMIHIVTRFQWLKKTPDWITLSTHQLLGIAMSSMLWLQRKLKVDIPVISGN